MLRGCVTIPTQNLTTKTIYSTSDCPSVREFKSNLDKCSKVTTSEESNFFFFGRKGAVPIKMDLNLKPMYHAKSSFKADLYVFAYFIALNYMMLFGSFNYLIRLAFRLACDRYLLVCHLATNVMTMTCNNKSVCVYKKEKNGKMKIEKGSLLTAYCCHEFFCYRGSKH
jgi:hypothetical protein